MNGSKLPPGLAFDGATGRIYGTPTQTGTFNFTVQAIDSSPASGFAEKLTTFDFLAPEVVTSTKSFQLDILAPTAASVSVGGRVLDANGRGVSKAVVTLTDGSGNVRYAVTNPFGFYRFADVPAGASCVVSVVHKQFDFTPQVVNITESLTEINFVAAPE